MARKPWYEGPWKKIRLEVLERDSRRCQIRGPGCSGEASEVDHILPVSLGGAWWDHENLRASCSRCNQMRNIKRTVTPSRMW
jgi:5-methylcytosine-specific restriction endonuclease McrA